MITDDKNNKNSPNWEIIGGVAPLFHSLANTLSIVKAVQEKEMGINGLAIMILVQLAQQDGLTQNYLTSCTRADPSMITRIVKEFEQERGWVRRERDPEDNRLMRVWLTEAGREQIQNLPARVAVIEQKLTRNLTEQDLQELRRILSVMAQSAREELDNSNPN